MIGFLLNEIKNPQHGQNEVLIHGGCQGLGLVGLASEDAMLYEELKNVLFANQAVTGEAAGMAAGLVMAGSNSKDV